jgi:hypothetical protein
VGKFQTLLQPDEIRPKGLDSVFNTTIWQIMYRSATGANRAILIKAVKRATILASEYSER